MDTHLLASSEHKFYASFPPKMEHIRHISSRLEMLPASMDSRGSDEGDEREGPLRNLLWEMMRALAYAIHRSSPQLRCSSELLDQGNWPISQLCEGNTTGSLERGRDFFASNNLIRSCFGSENHAAICASLHRRTASDVQFAEKLNPSEATPQDSDSVYRNEYKGKDAPIRIAAFFLIDYEKGRPCSLPTNTFSITNSQLMTRSIQLSTAWQVVLCFAVMCTFLCSFLEKSHNGDEKKTTWVMAVLTAFVVLVFSVDMGLKWHYRNEVGISDVHQTTSEHVYREMSSNKHQAEIKVEKTLSPGPDDSNENGGNDKNDYGHNNNNEEIGTVRTRRTRARSWTKPMVVLLVMLTIETMCKLLLNNSPPSVSSNEDPVTQWTQTSSSLPRCRRAVWLGVFKPVVFFYVSTRARDALEALSQVAPIVLRVLMMELFVLFSFAAVACHLYRESDEFADLKTAFLSLFELSTTVVNPSLWMPLYYQKKSSALFFVFFIIFCVFYLHSLVLSVVYQSYIHAMTKVRERSKSDREVALRLAFLALQNEERNESGLVRMVKMIYIRRTLEVLRPHYGPRKINALLHIVDPYEAGAVNFDTFRNNVPKALGASLRSAHLATTASLLLELFAAFLAMANLVYVILLSSSFESEWWDKVVVPGGALITVLCIIELLLRLNSCHLSSFTQPAQFDLCLDGLAVLAGATSLCGVMLHIFNPTSSIECLLIGRAIDTVRVMHFFEIFRDIVRRSREVLPALVGPVALILSALHILTCIGMTIWGGAIEVGTHDDEIAALYDLNNFNTYSSGLVTVFQLLVVNDWHAIARVYLFATRCSKPYIVYPFFIGVNLIGVSILLNVLTAFFVGAFVTRLNSCESDKRDISVHTVRASHSVCNLSNHPALEIDTHVGRSEFHVFERQGFDQIMETVVGGTETEYEGGAAKKTCEVLELFDFLTQGSSEKIGYMVCRQHSEDRYGNRRFLAMTKMFISDEVIHKVITEMHSELVSQLSIIGKSDISVQRMFPSVDDSDICLQIAASLLWKNLSISLFVSRLVKAGNVEIPTATNKTNQIIETVSQNNEE